MSKPQLFIQTYVVCACIALGSFLSVHGGLAGDFDRQLISTSDPHAKNVYAASLLFNRWRIHFPSEPFIFRAFVIANAPADIFARLTFKGIQVSNSSAPTVGYCGSSEGAGQRRRWQETASVKKARISRFC